MPFYLTPKQDDFNKIPEIQVCVAEALSTMPYSVYVDRVRTPWFSHST